MVLTSTNISPDYFYDNMTWLELDAILKNIKGKAEEKLNELRVLIFYNSPVLNRDIIQTPMDLFNDDKPEPTKQDYIDSQNRILAIVNKIAPK